MTIEKGLQFIITYNNFVNGSAYYVTGRGSKMSLKIYDAMDVARHIINKSNADGCPLSNLKLQKVLYFIQADFLVNTKEHLPCFENRIEAWDFGPVIPDVYHEFKRYGSSWIPTVETYMDFSDGIWNSNRIEYRDNVITREDKERIDAMVDECRRYSATQLVKITHNQKPWKNAYRRGYNMEITIEAIKEYYNVT